MPFPSLTDAVECARFTLLITPVTACVALAFWIRAYRRSVRAYLILSIPMVLSALLGTVAYFPLLNVSEFQFSAKDVALLRIDRMQDNDQAIRHVASLSDGDTISECLSTLSNNGVPRWHRHIWNDGYRAEFILENGQTVYISAYRNSKTRDNIYAIVLHLDSDPDGSLATTVGTFHCKATYEWFRELDESRGEAE